LFKGSVRATCCSPAARLPRGSLWRSGVRETMDSGRRPRAHTPDPLTRLARVLRHHSGMSGFVNVNELLSSEQIVSWIVVVIRPDAPIAEQEQRGVDFDHGHLWPTGAGLNSIPSHELCDVLHRTTDPGEKSCR